MGQFRYTTHEYFCKYFSAWTLFTNIVSLTTITQLYNQKSSRHYTNYQEFFKEYAHVYHRLK